MVDRRWPEARWAGIAEELISTEPALAHIAASDVRIAYLSSDARKSSRGRALLGQCEKVPDRYRWAVPYDFIVTVFEPNVEGLSDSQLRMLVLHELMHVGIEPGADGEARLYVAPHDVEDFREVIRRFGLDWSRTPDRSAE